MVDPGPPMDLSRKFRQAAFAYLHVGLLYEYAVYAFWRQGLLENVPGHPLAWLALGATIVAEGAFLRAPGEGRVPPEFYLFAIIVIVVNLWMLARAAWDL